MGDSEVVVMFVTPGGEGTARNISKWHKIMERRRVGKGSKGRNRKNSKKVKIKECRNRHGVAQRVPGGSGSQISLHSAPEFGEVVRLTNRAPLPP